MLKLHEFFLTFFYCGKAKKAPGTVGSFASLLFWLGLTAIFFNQQFSLAFQNIFWGSFLIIVFIYGCFASLIYSKQFKQIDHPSIVIDEVVGQIICLQISFYFISNYFENRQLIIFHLLINFIFFRFFDIVKPSLIGVADKKFKNGFGIMFDDVLSGFISALFSTLLIRLIFS